MSNNLPNIHHHITALCRQASGLAPRFTEHCLEACGDLAPEFAATGPRQARAQALIAEAFRLNALSDDPAAVAAEGFTAQF